MHIIGRNDPCPCGSGKKNKHCCGARVHQSPEMIYNNIRRLDGESGNLLLIFAKQRYGTSGFEKALEDFGYYDEIPLELSSPAGDSFLRWFTFNWRPMKRETIAELFLSENKTTLHSDLIRFIEKTVQAPYSYFQTLEVDPGKELSLRDILRKREFRVYEKSASTILQRGQILFARVVEIDGIHFLMGSGSVIIPPIFLDRFLVIRSCFEKSSTSPDGTVTAKILLEMEEELREVYFDIEEEVINPKYTLRNTDGDPLVLHTLTYKISSAEGAFHALKELEQKCTGITDDELLADAERNETGALIRTTIRWVKKSKKSNMGDFTSLATLTVTPSQLIVEVNSEKRSRRIRREIHKRLGQSAIPVATEMNTAEELLEQASVETLKTGRKKEDDQDRLLRNSPEVKEMINKLSERHWAGWPDIPLPGLRGKTPRQAVKDPVCRELLESLLMDFDIRNRQQDDGFLRVDTAKLRRDLGLDS